MKLWTSYLAGLLAWASLIAVAQFRDAVAFAVEPQPAPLDILIVAPHSDDEAIGCTAVIMRAITAGKRIGVVVVTNGDGFPKAAAAITKKPRDQLVPEDYIKLTGIRQQHTLTAMRQLGLKTEDLVFLGYPDAGLGRVYAAEGSAPFRQRFTQEDETYGVIVPDYHTQVHGHPAPYTRASVVGDLTEIIKARQPKEIYVTSEVDGHAEHRVSFWVVRDAVKAAGWRGTVFTYLVHGHTPPKGPELRLRLTAEEFEKKKAIIQEYAKHMSPIHDRLAEKFTKPEEVFWPVRIE
jgi:LmbE family N-acetylglucosaminyl deacetylase